MSRFYSTVVLIAVSADSLRQRYADVTSTTSGRRSWNRMT